MHKYPNLASALASASELKRIATSNRWLQNVPQVVNDLWTLQGISLYYLFGSNQGFRALAPEDAIPADDFFTSMGPPRVTDSQFCDAVDGLLEQGRPFGASGVESGDSFSTAIPGFRADRVRWDLLFGWCAWQGAILVARLTSAHGLADGVGAPAPE